MSHWTFGVGCWTLSVGCLLYRNAGKGAARLSNSVAPADWKSTNCLLLQLPFALSMGDEHVHYPILTEKFAMAKPFAPETAAATVGTPRHSEATTHLRRADEIHAWQARLRN